MVRCFGRELKFWLQMLLRSGVRTQTHAVGVAHPFGRFEKIVGRPQAEASSEHIGGVLMGTAGTLVITHTSYAAYFSPVE